MINLNRLITNKEFKLNGLDWRRLSLDQASSIRGYGGKGNYYWVAVDTTGTALGVGSCNIFAETFSRLKNDLNVRHWFDSVEWICVSLSSGNETSSRDKRNELIELIDPLHYPKKRKGRTASNHGMPVLSDGLYLYEYKDAQGEVVYVGITKNIYGRNRQHRKANWWSSDLKLHFKPYSNEMTARRKEREMIRDLAPLGNIQHNPNFRTA